MLEAADRVVLADGIVLRDDALVDDVCRTSWPVNATGAFVVARDDRPLGEIAERVAAAYALPVEQARADVLAFAWQLNRLALANVERRSGRACHAVAWLRLALRLAPAGALPPLTVRRRPLDTSTVTRAVVGVGRGLAARCTALALIVAALTAHVGLAVGRLSLLAPVAIGLAVGVGLAAHEAAHAAALRGVPSALVVRGSRVSVVHAPAGEVRRVLVALAGPGSVAAAGLCLLAAGVALGAPTLAAAGGSGALHAAALTVLASDGRTACGLSS
jgi:hypothetical protein